MNMDDICAFQDKLYKEGKMDLFFKSIDDMCQKFNNSEKSKHKFLSNSKTKTLIFKEKLPKQKKSVVENENVKIKKKTIVSKIPKSKAFVCTMDNCEKSFTSAYGLKYHLKHGHTREKIDVYKPFVCSISSCNKTYKNHNGLKYHLKTFHNIDVSKK